MTKSETPLTYKDAGVDIEAGNAFVSAIKNFSASTRRPGGDGELGGFGGLFDLKAAGYVDPILVAATDGVGTKLRLAIDTGLHDGVGIDLVAMCVNDLIVQGAEPLFFLDYMATGKLHVDAMARIVASIADGCRQAGAALIGGETAEMPGMYAGGDYDLAGFAVGAVERGHLMNGSEIAAGDCLIGIASSGPHSNGYSLIRKIIERSGCALADPAPFNAELSVAEALLMPTRIYIQSLLPLIRAGHIKGLAHITGGGFIENIPRILPQGLAAHVDSTRWTLPPVFEWLQSVGHLSTEEMATSFNCGVGMVAVIDADNEKTMLNELKQAGEDAWSIGHIEHGPEGCIVTGKSGTWGQESNWSVQTKESV